HCTRGQLCQFTVPKRDSSGHGQTSALLGTSYLAVIIGAIHLESINGHILAAYRTTDLTNRWNSPPSVPIAFFHAAQLYSVGINTSTAEYAWQCSIHERALVDSVTIAW